MSPAPPSSRKPARGVSELYASMLMIGVTLSVGGMVTSAAISHFDLQSNSAALGESLQQASTDKHLGLVYAVAAPGSGGCTTTYLGATEGNSLTFAIFNFGYVPFTPSMIWDNETSFWGSWQTVAPGAMGHYLLQFAKCVHATGQTVMLVDSSGDEFQFET